MKPKPKKKAVTNTPTGNCVKFLQHLIVNFYILPLGLLLGASDLGIATFGGMIANWATVTLGNTIGALLVTLPVWFQDRASVVEQVDKKGLVEKMDTNSVRLAEKIPRNTPTDETLDL